ncbi:MAG: hypothetical protein V3U60_13530 [Gammaproteobacteria bacterium]
MPKFSPSTIVQLVKAFGFATHAPLDQLALVFGFQEVLGGDGIEKRETRLMKHLVESPNLQGPNGSPMILELAEHLFKERCERSWDSPDPADRFPDLVRALSQDGYGVKNFKLHAMLPEAVPVAEHQDELLVLLDNHGFGTARGHLEQAIDAHTRGDWAAANAQLRSFVEELFDRIAEVLSGGHTTSLSTSHERREWLATTDPPVFDPALNEWEIGNKGGFVQAFWRRLHPQGSHPGLSDEADCTFRLHIVLIVAAHFMKRFDDRCL